MPNSTATPFPRNTLPLLAALALLGGPTSPASADLIPGLISDFQSGTVEGWEGSALPTNIANGGPLGAGDRFLQIGDSFRNLATFNTSVAGVLDPAVLAIEVDLMRPADDPDPLDIRLVLFGPGTTDRWTSATAAQVPNDGIWRRYSFSVLEADLAHVFGSLSYADLAGGLNRIMFRYDPGTPDPTGTSASGTLGIDNIVAVPEPGTALLLLGAAALFGAFGATRRVG